MKGVKCVLALLLLARVVPAAAEVHCAAEVYYKWRKADEEELKVFWAKTVRSAESEEKARAQLEAALNRARQKADAACRREHENLTGCMAVKFETKVSVLAELGFSSRKALEDAIAADCRGLQGSCAGTLPFDITCEASDAVVESEGEEAGEQDSDKGKKDRKRSKK